MTKDSEYDGKSMKDSALRSFALPDFNVDAPFSVVDRLTYKPVLHWKDERQDSKIGPDDAHLQEREKHGTDWSINNGLEKFFSNEQSLDMGLLSYDEKDLQTYDVMKIGLGDTLSQWPRTLNDFKENDFELDLEQNSSFWQTSYSVSRRKEKTLGNAQLIRPVLPSDFRFRTSVEQEKDSELSSNCSASNRMAECSLSHFLPYRKTMLASLFTAARGHSIDHFLWNEERMLFVRKSTQEAGQGEGIKSVYGISGESATSIEERFLTVGALQRRLRWRIESIRSFRNDQSTMVMPPEMFAFAGALSDVIDYVEAQLDIYERENSDHGLLECWKKIENIEMLLLCLASMVKCNLERPLPFPTIIESSSVNESKLSAQILSLIYGQVIAAVESSAPAPVVGALDFILHTTSLNWRRRVVNWIGWPCDSKDRIIDEVDTQMRIGREDKRRAEGELLPKGAGTSTCRCEPWAGMEVEWSWDDRSELDVGYTLRPVRLPSFLPIAHARDLLEAGRALRLLRRAAPEGHPLLSLNDHNSRNKRQRLKMPGWYARNADTSHRLTEADDALTETMRDAKREIAAWRRYRTQMADTGVDKTTSAFHSVQIATQDEEKKNRPFSWSSTAQSLADRLETFDKAPRGAIEYDLESQGIVRREDSIQYFIETRPEEEERKLRSVGSRTSLMLLQPMLRWSQLVNASLVSVFFRDLHLGEYLDICRRFLLLSDQSFASLIVEVLFDDGSSRQKNHAGEELIDGVGLSTLLRSDSSWPPGGSELPIALNNTVLESIANAKLVHSKSHSKLRSRESIQERFSSDDSRGAEQAYLDLDDRLSFAIVKPDHGTSAWHDRQSIDALDWLTISFRPPPLIAPLITLQTQIAYQRLFRHLLRLMRVDIVLKGIFRKLMSRSQTLNGLPDWMDEEDIERASRLRFEANHFVSTLFHHFSDLTLAQRWKTFRNRLNGLFRSAEMQEEEMIDDVEKQLNKTYSQESSEDNASFPDNASEYDADTDGIASTINGDNVTDGGNREGHESSSSYFDLKDVFSIATYHERTMDKMLDGCFLKSRQKAIMTIILDMFNIILSFGQLLQRKNREETNELRMFSDQEKMNANAVDGLEASKLLSTFFIRFQSKMRLLVHALELIGQRAMNRETTVSNLGNLSVHRLRKFDEVTNQSFSKPRLSSSSASSHRSKRYNPASNARHAAIDAEIARQEAEMKMDLEQLEFHEQKESMGDLEVIQGLIIALRGN